MIKFFPNWNRRAFLHRICYLTQLMAMEYWSIDWKNVAERWNSKYKEKMNRMSLRHWMKHNHHLKRTTNFWKQQQLVMKFSPNSEPNYWIQSSIEPICFTTKWLISKYSFRFFGLNQNWYFTWAYLILYIFSNSIYASFSLIVLRFWMILMVDILVLAL